MNRVLVALAAVISLSSAATGQIDQSALMERFLAYKYGSDRAVLDEVAAWASDARKDPNRRKEAASELAGVLSSNAALEVKQSACRNLVLLATEDQITPLAKLLQDEDLAHYAVLALAHISGNAVDDLLRMELKRTSARTQTEIIDILGERQCSAAIPDITAYLESPDLSTSESAASALAKTANWLASGPLIQAYRRADNARSLMLGHAVLDFGSRLLRAGDRGRALTVFETLDRTTTDAPTGAAAFLGIVKIKGANGLPEVMKALGEDGSLRQSV